jgi:hypothetical protein
MTGMTNKVIVLVVIAVFAGMLAAYFIFDRTGETNDLSSEPGGVFSAGSRVVSFTPGSQPNTLDLFLADAAGLRLLIGGIQMAGKNWSLQASSRPNIVVLLGVNGTISQYFIDINSGHVLKIEMNQQQLLVTGPQQGELAFKTTEFGPTTSSLALLLGVNNSLTKVYIPDPQSEANDYLSLDLASQTIAPAEADDEVINLQIDVSPSLAAAEEINQATGEISTTDWLDYTSEAYSFQLKYPSGWSFTDSLPLNPVVPTKQLVLFAPSWQNAAGSRVSVSIHQVEGDFPFQAYASNFFAPSPFTVTSTTINGLPATVIEYYQLANTRITIIQRNDTYAAILLVPGSTLTINVYNTLLSSFKFN